MKYFLLLGTLFIGGALMAEPIEQVYTGWELFQAYKRGWDDGLNKKMVGCTLRTM